MKKLFLKKNIKAQVIEAARERNAGVVLKRTLGPWQLAFFGIGAIIGAGIFTLTGAGAAYYAGPAIAFSFILAGSLNLFAGLCYSEMAAMLPVSGAVLIKIGALAGLTSVLIGILFGQSRIFYAMGRDGLLPWFDRLHPRNATPHVAITAATCIIAAACGVLPMQRVGELASIGTLLAFMIVCIGIPILRVTNPGAIRPFRVPFPWIVGPLGALACAWVMSALPAFAWLRLVT